MAGTQKKFAWFPRVVDTWRSYNTKAIIWLQWYYVKGDDKLVSLNGETKNGTKYCLNLGYFSYEL